MLPLEALEPGVGLLEPRDLALELFHPLLVLDLPVLVLDLPALEFDLANLVFDDGMPIEPRQPTSPARTETPICLLSWRVGPQKKWTWS